MITTTLNRIKAHSPCEDGWKKLLNHLGKTKADDEPLSFAVILKSNGVEDALWCCRCEPQYAKEWRLFAVWCVRQQAHLLTDQRSKDALDVAERHAHGKATDEELDAARAAGDAARDAAWAALDAARAAGDAAGDAARAAAEAAAEAAAWTAWATAWATAGTVAGAAGDAAGAAAWEVAWAARAAAGDAAWAAARAARAAAMRAAWAAGDAAWAAQAKEFLRVVTETRKRSADIKGDKP